MSNRYRIVLFVLACFAFCGTAKAAASFSVVASQSDGTCDGSSINGGVTCSFFANAGGSVISDSLGVTNLTANSIQFQVSVSTSNGGGWLSASESPNPLAGNKPGSLTITVNPKSLPPLPNGAAYNGSVTISGGGTSVSIPVSLTTSGVALALSPGSVSITLTTGGKASQNIHFINPNNNSSLSGIGANIQCNQSWCSISGSDGNGFVVNVDATSLSPGSPSATVTVQYNGNGSPFVTVGLGVSVTVSAPAKPVISPTFLNFAAFSARSNPAAQPFSITTSDGSTQGFTVTALPPFASVSPGSGTASGNPANVSVTVNTSALSVGSNSGTITVTLVDGATTNISVSANLGQFSISASPNPPSPVTLAQGKTQAIPFSVGTADNGQLSVTVTTQTNTGSGWLTAPASLSAPGQVQVTANAGAMAPGTYTGSVTFACPSANVCTSITIPISLTVTVLASLSASPASLSFQAPSGGSLPPAQPVTVSSSDQSPQQFSFTFSPQGSWLKVTASQTTTPATLTASILSLPAQNSSGSITITPADGAPVVNVPVTFLTSANQPVIPSGGVIFASSFGGFAVATSGSFLEIYGSNLASGQTDWGASFKNNVAPTLLGGVSVQIDGKAAFVSYVSPNQVNVLAPDNLSVGGTVQVVLSNGNGTSAPVTVKSAALEPGLLAPSNFTFNGKQYVVAFLPDGNFALPTGALGNSRPAKPNEVLVMYGLGFGPVTPANPVGTLEQGSNKLQNPLQMSFGTTAATLQYDGLAPGFAGLYQFNVVVPSVPDNDAVPLTFNLGGVAGTQTLFIAVHQ